MSDGCRIDVDLEPDYDPQTLELYILGNMLGLLMQQRGLLVMHGNLLEKNGRGLLICGHSTSGKSTLSAALVKEHGFRLVSDDLAVFDGTGHGVRGAQELKLWRDAIEALRLPLDDLTPLNAQVDKHRWTLNEELGQVGRVPLAGVYILSSENSAQEAEFDELKGMEKLLPLKAQVYRRQAVDAMGLTSSHFVAISQLFGGVPCVRVGRAIQGAREESVHHLANAVAADTERRGVSL